VLLHMHTRTKRVQVAGKLSMKERMFKTMTGKDVALRIFVQENNLGKVSCASCMPGALQRVTNTCTF